MLAVFQSDGLILDDRAILGDGQIELALAEQLLRFAERAFAVKWHRQHFLNTEGEVNQSYQIPAAAQAG